MVWWRFDDGFPAGAYQTRVSEARFNWNKANSHLYFYWDQSATVGPQSNVSVRWIDITTPIPDNTLGLAFLQGCPVPQDRNCYGTINIDKYAAGYAWYTGTITTVPAQQFDLETLAAHEWGHLLQFSHDTSSSSYVMDAPLDFAFQNRCPNNHEVSTLRSMYGAHGTAQSCVE